MHKEALELAQDGDIDLRLNLVWFDELWALRSLTTYEVQVRAYENLNKAVLELAYDGDTEEGLRITLDV